MPFRSILFGVSEIVPTLDQQQPPDFFVDLNFDQAISAITAGRDEYNLKPFFYAPLADVETINYRYDVLRDLEDPALMAGIQSFTQEMRAMRAHLTRSEKAYYQYEKESWFLEAVRIYCAAVSQLARELGLAELRSSGFRAFREYLAAYAESEGFVSLSTETERLRNDLSSIRYSLLIEGKRITVSRHEPAPDYGADVLRTFEKFKQGAAKDYRFEFRSGPDMDHVEAAILDRVARLFPDVFLSLDEYCRRQRAYLDYTLAEFDREVQFYVACLEYTAPFKEAGLAFCYPSVVTESKEVYALNVFDLALASRLIHENIPVVKNDFRLQEPERIFVVSGPNQGGKTTFARTFGQLHYLAAIGCPVPAADARLFLFDRLFTHFEREEDIRNLSGKLEDDLLRIHRILELATPRSILIMNESFLSTTLGSRHRLLMSAGLGKGSRGENYILRKPQETKQSWLERLQNWVEQLPGRPRSSYVYEIADRDESGFRILSELIGRGISPAAAALGQSTDHILGFFSVLRLELGFYLGCLNLRDVLAAKGEPICFPEPLIPDRPVFSCRGLYDVCLSLHMQDRVAGNDVNGDSKLLVIITGANRGGKSTFLRSAGLAQLMMQCGMFVAAESFRANVCAGVFTHFKREEDTGMRSGKLDEELGRMSTIVDKITPNSVVLLNESFASTNEREGSEIGRQIVRALLDNGVKVLYVTHMFDLAKGFYLSGMDETLFLRAERFADGRRTFRLVEGEPLPTSHAVDLYRRIFGEGASSAAPSPYARSGLRK